MHWEVVEILNSTNVHVIGNIGCVEIFGSVIISHCRRKRNFSVGRVGEKTTQRQQLPLAWSAFSSTEIDNSIDDVVTSYFIM
jgi:hypothetical protein